MPLQYSAETYHSAVLMRGKRTFLVEGQKDKGVVAKLIIALKACKAMVGDNVVVDTAQDFSGLSGGNRERVETIHAKLGGSVKFAALVDREFRNFDLQNANDKTPLHVEIPKNLFWTRGHSIENYFSDPEYVIACLEQHYPEHLPAEYPRIIENAFPSMLHSSASITLALEPNNLLAEPKDRIVRVSSVKQLELWNALADGSIGINRTAFVTTLTRLGFSQANADALVQRQEAHLANLQQKDLDISKWICHGHLADSYLWSALGALLQHHGMESKHATQIAWHNRQAQGRTSTDFWSAACVARRCERPEGMISWLCA